MNKPDLDTFIANVLSGDIDAYEQIVRQYQQDVWKIVAAMLLNTAQTEDLVQQTFVSAYRHLHQFKRGHDFSAWIKQIARNQVRQELRARGRETDRLHLYHQHLLNSLENSAEAEDALAKVLNDCTKELPPEAAKVLELRYEKAWDFTQIAAALGRTVEAARQHLARIRIALRDCVQKRLSHL